MAIGSDDHAAAIAAGVDLAAGSAGMVRRLAAAAAEAAGRPARVHLKADTGLSRGGATAADWPSVLDAASAGASATAASSSRGSGRTSPPPTSRATRRSRRSSPRSRRRWRSRRARASPRRCGTSPTPRPRSTCRRPATTWCGSAAAATAWPPCPAGRRGWLRPAMTLRARLALVKRVPAGTGVSYGHRYVTPRETTLGLVPLGYADGIPRAATGLPLVFARGRRWPIAGHGLHGPAGRRLRRRAGGGGGRGGALRAGGRRGDRPPRSGARRSARSRTRS